MLPLLLCLPWIAPAQMHLPLKKKDPDTKTHNLDKVVETLRGGEKPALNDLATELHIMAPDPSNPSAVSDSVCNSFSQVEDKKLRMKQDAQDAVIVAYSKDCDSTYFIAFEEANKSGWRHLSTLRLSSRVQKPEVTYAEILRPGVSEVLVHGAITRDAGSVQQANFLVLQLWHDRLRSVLDTVERLDIDLPVLPSDDSDEVKQSLRSTFKVVEADAKSGASARILEQQVITERKSTITLHRSWIWSPELERFWWTASDETDLAQWPPAQAPAKTAAKPAQAKPAGIPSSPK